MSETAIPFGIHIGKDITDPSIPLGYLHWLHQEKIIRVPSLAKAVEGEIGRREAARQSAPKPPVAAPTSARTWVAAQVTASFQGLSPRQYVAMSRRSDGDFDFETLNGESRTGVVPAANVQHFVQSLKDAKGGRIMAGDPGKLRGMIPAAPAREEVPAPEGKQDEEQTPTQEQQAIFDKFAKIRASGQHSHIIIGAAAGSGKTWLLVKLAKMFGKPGERWLYLVFNTRNKVEGKEKFKDTPWVEVKTSNGLFGEILRDPKNVSRIRQTERMAQVADGLPEKARILVDGPKFSGLMDSFGLKAPDAIGYQYGDMTKNIASLLRSMRYNFKEEVLTLFGLAKAYSVDPRKADAKKQIEAVADKYDIDFELSEVKERISKYKDTRWKDRLLAYLEEVMGYDFMRKNFKPEMFEATEIMLRESLPGVSDHVHQHQISKTKSVDLDSGQMRDFNDDLWFVGTHADDLAWPHYDVVLADEAQDFNSNHQRALEKLREEGANLVAVGDKNQSLYRFNGADSEAFDKLGNKMEDWSDDKDVRQSLTHNFRSLPEVIEFSNKHTHVKTLKAGRKAKPGEVGEATHSEIDYDQAFDRVVKERAEGNKEETAFIAPTNEPLVHAALKLLGSGIPFVILGKDVAGDVKKHIDTIMRIAGIRDQDSASTLSDRLQEHLDKEKEFHGEKSSKKAYLKGLDETTNAILAALRQFDGGAVAEEPPEQGERQGFGRYAYERSRGAGGKTIADFKGWLKAKLGGLDVENSESDIRAYKKKKEEEQPVILTTGHKSKGLEFSRVFILRNDLYPGPRAKRKEDIIQGENNRHVSYTRGKRAVHVLKLEGQPGYKK